MHQEHNIPWNLLASNFTFICDNPRFTPRRTGLFPRDRSNQGRELNHFAREMMLSITTFFETERAKYPSKVDIPTDGKLFPDVLRERFPQYLSKRTQNIDYWISRARQRLGAPEQCNFYITSDGDLADVVKVLMNENEITSLLILAQHPKIPLHHLWELSWGHHFGVNRVAETALQGYIFCNLIAATNTLQNGEYKKMTGYMQFLSHAIDVFDFPAQNIPHIAFFGSSFIWPDSMPEIHQDLWKLKKYLKKTFRLLYVYDLVSRECGAKLQWDSEIARNMTPIISACCVNHFVECVQIENGSKEWVYRFISK